MDGISNNGDFLDAYGFQGLVKSKAHGHDFSFSGSNIGGMHPWFMHNCVVLP